MQNPNFGLRIDTVAGNLNLAINETVSVRRGAVTVQCKAGQVRAGDRVYHPTANIPSLEARMHALYAHSQVYRTIHGAVYPDEGTRKGRNSHRLSKMSPLFSPAHHTNQ